MKEAITPAAVRCGDNWKSAYRIGRGKAVAFEGPPLCTREAAMRYARIEVSEWMQRRAERGK
jgi:hypothetical protein